MGRWTVGVRVVFVVGCVLAGAGMPTAVADPDPQSRPLGCVPEIGTLQIIPPLPGLFLPLPSIKGPSEFDDLPLAPAGLDFPPAVELRDTTQGFNDVVEVVLRAGALYARPRGQGGPWRAVATPGCLNGQIVAMSLNNNMLVAADANGWIYSLDNLLSGPMLWNWTYSYGAPIWLWPGDRVAASDLPSQTWAISHRMSTSFDDAEGNRHPTTAGLVELVSLTGDGSRIVYQDPWLPPDRSYEIGGPLGGRFISESLSVSGSVTFVMNRHGDMYTRKYDLDMAGANHIPGRYTWQEQGSKPSAPNQLVERFDPQYAAIALPAQDWIAQPKIPGEITGRISVHDSGPAVENRELRVEGRRDGVTGYWFKDLAAPDWQFTATNQPLRQAILAANPAVDQSSLTLAPESELSFRGALPAGWTLAVDHFDWAQTKHAVTLTSPTGRAYPIALYTTDELRLLSRGAGLDQNPRGLEGALDLRPADPRNPDNAELGRFIDSTLNGQLIYEVKVEATESRLVIDPLGSVLDRG